MLTDVVRKDQHDPGLEIQDWTVEPFRAGNPGLSNGGLFRFSGQSSGTEGIRPWTVVLKCIKLPNDDIEQQREWTYLRREIQERGLWLKTVLQASIAVGLSKTFYAIPKKAFQIWR